MRRVNIASPRIRVRRRPPRGLPRGPAPPRRAARRGADRH